MKAWSEKKQNEWESGMRAAGVTELPHQANPCPTTHPDRKEDSCSFFCSLPLLPPFPWGSLMSTHLYPPLLPQGHGEARCHRTGLEPVSKCYAGWIIRGGEAVLGHILLSHSEPLAHPWRSPCRKKWGIFYMFMLLNSKLEQWLWKKKARKAPFPCIHFCLPPLQVCCVCSGIQPFRQLY